MQAWMALWIERLTPDYEVIGLSPDWVCLTNLQVPMETVLIYKSQIAIMLHRGPALYRENITAWNANDRTNVRERLTGINQHTTAR